MEVALLSPPFTDPMVPPPALAALVESLSPSARVVAHDLNLEVYNALFDSLGADAAVSPGGVRFGERVRSAFGNIPSLLELKKLEQQLLDWMGRKAGDRFRIGRCVLDPGDLWPEPTLMGLIEMFEESLFGQALRGCVERLLPELLRADRILISVIFDSQCVPGLLLARLLRQWGYEGILVLGGVLPSWVHGYLASTALVREGIDMIYIGEFSSDAWRAIASLPSGSKQRQAGRGAAPVVCRPAPRGGQNPVPAELLLDGSGYAALPLRDYWGAEPLVCMAVSKGCYYAECSFCAYGHIRDHAYTCLPARKAAERVLSFQEKLGVSVLCLETDVIDPESLVGFARELKRIGSTVTWHAATRFEASFAPQHFETLFEGGCRRLYFGLESGSPRTLARMRKGIDVNDVRRILRHCAETGIGVELGIIFGFPGEVDEDARATLDFLAEHIGIIHRIDPSPFRCMRNSPVALHPEAFGVAVRGTSANGYTLHLTGNTGAPAPLDPIEYIRAVHALNPDRFQLDISEDIWLTCRLGVAALEAQTRRGSRSHPFGGFQHANP